MTLKVGDKVRVLQRAGFREGDTGTLVEDRGDSLWDVRGDGWTNPGSSLNPGCGTYGEGVLEKIEEPAPKFKVGDRVRLIEDYCGHKAGALGVVTDANSVGGEDHARVRLDGGGYVWPFARRLEKVESVPFKLERGDRVVNRKTGRKGTVIFGVVYDEDDPFTEGVPVKALEEYEEHYPGTYDLIKKDAPW